MTDLTGSKTLPSVKRRALRIVLGIVAAIVILAVCTLLYRAWRQHENALALAIDPKTGVEETMFVSLGGVEQWVQIRGDDRKNPVLLFVHGGPGSPVSPVSSLLRTWEKYFTVVMWDQRDAGKTFVRNGAVREMSLPRVTQDGIELAQFLCGHLGKRKIIVLGHSWGTMVGLGMVVRRPDLFLAYVGTGQVVSIAEKEPVIYARAMERLRAAHDEDGIRMLSASGAPPYRSELPMRVERTMSERTDIPTERTILRDLIPIALVAPDWSLWDIYRSLQASDYAEDATFDADASYDARKFGLDLRLPFFIINGALDHVTPTDLAQRYFDKVHAPQKQFVVLNSVGHSAVLTEPDVFLHELVTRVRPSAMRLN